MKLAFALCVLGSAAAADDAVLVFRSTKGEVRATAASVVDATATEVAGMGLTIAIALDPAAAGELAVLTERSLGLPMEILVCGKVVAAPTVMEVIAGGRVALSGSGLGSVDAVIPVLRGEAGCP